MRILNAPISMSEQQLAISRMKSAKAPGPERITAIYYKKIQDALIQPLKDTMNRILVTGVVPASWKNAYIALINKTVT